MFTTRVPPSEFTLRAFEHHVKELEDATFFSKTDLYGILSGERADHLLYGRELHKGLCKCRPDVAKEYRDLLASDADLVTAKVPMLAEGSDELEIKKLCDGLTSALLMGEEDKQDAMRRLHAYLSGRLRHYSKLAHLRSAG